MRAAICPGSFDPVTFGHLDIIERAAGVFDRILVVVFTNPRKAPLFTVQERVDMLCEVTAPLPNVEVDSSEGLLSDYASKRGVFVVVKGLRAVSDFEAEFQMARMNKKLEPRLETVFVTTSSEFAYLSSSIVKEVASFGGCVGGLVPETVARHLRRRLGPSGGKP